MKLKRKKDAPIIYTSEGVPHPNIIATILSSRRDRKNKVLELSCGYFHSPETLEGGWGPIPIGIFGFIFNLTGIPAEKKADDTIIKLGKPTYDEVNLAIAEDEDGNITKVADDVEYWVLNQIFELDIEGKPFSENWEFAD